MLQGIFQEVDIHLVDQEMPNFYRTQYESTTGLYTEPIPSSTYFHIKFL
jgi:hypothetical protein